VERNEVLILYSSIMVSLLAIVYVLIITNPPSDLLRYDNFGTAHIIDNLSLKEIPNHWISISIFSGLLAFLTFFIGVSMAIVYEVVGKREAEEKRNWEREVILSASLLLLVMLGLLLLPYYGIALTSTVMPIGYLAGLLGMSLFSKILGAKFSIVAMSTIGIVITLIEFLAGVISAQVARYYVIFFLILAVVLEVLRRIVLRKRGRQKPERSPTAGQVPQK